MVWDLVPTENLRDELLETTSVTDEKQSILATQHPNSFRTAVPFWGQTTWNLTGLSQKRNCGSKGVNGLRRVFFVRFTKKKQLVYGESKHTSARDVRHTRYRNNPSRGRSITSNAHHTTRCDTQPTAQTTTKTQQKQHKQHKSRGLVLWGLDWVDDWLSFYL